MIRNLACSFSTIAELFTLQRFKVVIHLPLSEGAIEEVVQGVKEEAIRSIRQARLLELSKAIRSERKEIKEAMNMLIEEYMHFFYIRILFIRTIRLKSKKNKNHLRIMFRLRSCCCTFNSFIILAFLYLFKS